MNIIIPTLFQMPCQELDTLRVILAEDLSPPLPDEDIQRLEQHLVVDAVNLGAPRPLALAQLVHGQHAALLARLLDVLFDLARPLLRLAPVHEHDFPLAPTAAAGRVLYPPVLLHEVEQLADVGHAQPAVQPAVVEEVRVGGGGEAEAEDAVVARVGEHEGGPLGELGVVGGQVGLPREEGGERVLAREAEGRRVGARRGRCGGCGGHIWRLQREGGNRDAFRSGVLGVGLVAQRSRIWGRWNGGFVGGAQG
ncbi:unnamed protein product [Clonostachys chloroleuca]|uniref:Uncharacterized protein n=1 Tax=Clonostachys chloroleuca TaxID=1926264 RepID=A0AA35MJB1_9HYPO|nr:unnamed protein product [Clonostachys chloroleuca]